MESPNGQRAYPLMMNIDFNDKNKKDEINESDKRKDDEIISLKKYIQKMNDLIRESLNMKIVPNLEDGFEFLSKRIKNSEDIPNYQGVISQWLNDLLKVDYIK